METLLLSMGHHHGHAGRHQHQHQHQQHQQQQPQDNKGLEDEEGMRSTLSALRLQDGDATVGRWVWGSTIFRSLDTEL